MEGLPVEIDLEFTAGLVDQECQNALAGKEYDPA
jgi:hypothetical protein